MSGVNPSCEFIFFAVRARSSKFSGWYDLPSNLPSIP